MADFGCSWQQLEAIAWMRRLKGNPPVALCPECACENYGGTGLGRGATGLTEEGDPCGVCAGEGYLDAEDAEDWTVSF